MKVGFFGGTFDPVHKGHVIMVEDAIRLGHLDRMLVVPAGRTVHKPADRVSSAGMRYMMCYMAFTDVRRVEVSRIEVLREHGSYTIDTLRELKATLTGKDRLYMVCGADILFDILHWRSPEAILREIRILASLRPGHDRIEMESRAHELRKRFGADITFFEARQTDVSSTAVREAVEHSLAITEMVPPAVDRFIRMAGLYGVDDPLESLDLDQQERLRAAERVLLAHMDPERLSHSLLTMTTAARLAADHGQDVYSAALAGLVHDCAKHLPPDDAIRYVDPGDAATLAEPQLYHGPAGAALAPAWFGIRDPLVLDAIRYHATGRSDMTWLDLVLYLADKAEPSRTYLGSDAVFEQARKDLAGAFLFSCEGLQEHLASRGKTMHPDTNAAIERLERSQLH